MLVLGSRMVSGMDLERKLESVRERLMLEVQLDSKV